MSRQRLIGLLAVAMLALGGWALAQQERPEAKANENGPFAVSPAGESAVLLETKSGKTWVLHRSVNGDAVWLPTKRLNSEEEALKWKRQELMLREEGDAIAKKREEEARRELELRLKTSEKK